MNAPLFSRPVSEESLRREIRALDAEIAAAREKRNGINNAIASRQLKKERLEAQLAGMTASPALPSPAMACSG
jgi:predicted  nucleic acid-binding Zn-ribbon protein